MGRISSSANVPRFFDIRIRVLSADVNFFILRIFLNNHISFHLLKMSFIKRQYNYFQTFNYKQITKKLSKVLLFYDLYK